MLTIGIICIIVSILLVIYSRYSLKNTHKINVNVDKFNQELEIKKNELSQQYQELNDKIIFLQSNKKGLEDYLDRQKHELDVIQSTITSSTKAKEELSQKAFENYCEILERKYKEYEEEYDHYKDALETSYSNKQLELMRELDETQKDLDKIRATRAAAIQAQTREKEIEEQLSFYCLVLPENELRDISVLESIKSKLVNPRILSMLVWQTYWQKPLNRLIADVVGTNIKCGIYKITNIKTKECYIGQAVNISDRWKQHCKCACGIDTPVGNKLYKAMQEYGIQNFSWEVLEEVPSAQLNEKEKYYINLYDSYNFGYNSNTGISK